MILKSVAADELNVPDFCSFLNDRLKRRDSNIVYTPLFYIEILEEFFNICISLSVFASVRDFFVPLGAERGQIFGGPEGEALFNDHLSQKHIHCRRHIKADIGERLARGNFGFLLDPHVQRGHVFEYIQRAHIVNTSRHNYLPIASSLGPSRNSLA